MTSKERVINPFSASSGDKAPLNSSSTLTTAVFAQN